MPASKIKSDGLLVARTPELRLPLDLVTESNGILGKKGSGKTSAGVVLYEEMYAAGVPVVAVDPKGDWYGIRASGLIPDSALPVPVLGGQHGDIPLEPSAGTIIADLIVREGMSCVLDVSEFSKAEIQKFMTAFASQLYKVADRTPMHLILEECHEYIPQMVTSADARMVGAWEKLVKLGRFKGIGVSLLSQRAASVNKNVLTQVDNLFILRTSSAQDRAAVKGWIEYQANAADILSTLASLNTGECWLYQPARDEPIRFRFRFRETFDAGQTPKVGEARRAPTNLATVDLSAIASAMADTIEKAKADDPKQLRATIVRLERQLAQQAANAAAAEPVIEIPQIPEDVREQLVRLAEQLEQLLQWAKPLKWTAPTDSLPTPEKQPLVARESVPMTPPRPAAASEERAPSVGSDPRVSKMGRAVLTVLATYGTRNHVQVAILAGYSSKSGSFSNALSALRTAGFITGGREAMTITSAGLDALGHFTPLPAGPALIDHWMRQVGPMHRAILSALILAYPKSMSADEIATATGYSPGSGTFSNALSKLRTLALIEGGRAAITASETLGEARS